jgi:hypothetical protein
MTDEQIKQTFTYHAPVGDQLGRYESLREGARIFAELIQKSCPESREKSLALTNVQQAVMWANASIAINGTPG